MTASSPDPGSVERAFAAAYDAVDQDAMVELRPDGFRVHLDRIIRQATGGLAVAGLLAVPVPAAGEDEVEVAATALAPHVSSARHDDQHAWRLRSVAAARATLVALAPYRQAERDAAEERGRRRGLEEAAQWADPMTASYLLRLAAGEIEAMTPTTRTGEEGLSCQSPK